MQVTLENHRLASINIKHHSSEVQAYYNAATSEWDKRKRSYAIKAYEIGTCKFEDLPMVAETVGRILEEFGRSGKGSYKNVEIPYANPLEATFAYFVDNIDHFYLRTRLAYEEGIEKYELHRRGRHYTSDSVFWLLEEAHTDAHSPYYVVHYHNTKMRYIEKEEYRNKDTLRKKYALSKKQFEAVLLSGEFVFKGETYTLKAVPSSIESSFEEHLKQEEALLKTQKNFFEQASAPERKYAIYLAIKATLERIASYKSLIEQNHAYNEKVKHLKGKSASELWNNRAKELNENYNAQHKDNKSL